MSGALYGIAIVATLPMDTFVTPMEAATSVLSYAITGAVLGFFIAGFAGLIRYLIVGSSRR